MMISRIPDSIMGLPPSAAAAAAATVTYIKQQQPEEQRQSTSSCNVFAGRSGLVVSASDCGVRGPKFESHRGRLCISRQPLRLYSFGHGLRISAAVPGST